MSARDSRFRFRAASVLLLCASLLSANDAVAQSDYIDHTALLDQIRELTDLRIPEGVQVEGFDYSISADERLRARLTFPVKQWFSFLNVNAEWISNVGEGLHEQLSADWKWWDPRSVGDLTVVQFNARRPATLTVGMVTIVLGGAPGAVEPRRDTTVYLEWYQPQTGGSNEK